MSSRAEPEPIGPLVSNLVMWLARIVLAAW
jgi:hypothetical protein